MARFVKKIFFFLIPFYFLIIYVNFLLFSSGEFYIKVDKILKSNEKYIIGFELDEKKYGYIKRKEIEFNKKKDVLIIGSSRALGFREEMFKQDFYNSGYTITKIDGMTKFIKSLNEKKKPRYLIATIDPWMFNENWNNTRTGKFNFYNKEYNLIPSIDDMIVMCKKVLKNGNSFVIKKKGNTKRLGLKSYNEKIGIRKDGSMDYNGLIARIKKNDTTLIDYNSKKTIDNIRKGKSKFQYGKDICKKSICELNELVNTCNKRKIQLILIFPPLSKVVLNELENNPNHKYFPKIKNEIQKITMKSNIELWFYNLEILKLS